MWCRSGSKNNYMTIAQRIKDRTSREELKLRGETRK
jgi:hypothetical protein